MFQNYKAYLYKIFFTPTSLTAFMLLGLFAFSSGSLSATTEKPISKPFMGWSSWSVQSSTRFGYGKNWLNEKNIKNAADAMNSKLKLAGYTYINIDAGWNADLFWNFHFDANGIPNPDRVRFPSGMKSVADYVHSKGLKLGLYIPAGLDKEVYNKNARIFGTNCRAQDIVVWPLTPSNMWGSNWKINYNHPCAQKYIDSIVDKFASWGVDFLKVDGVAVDNLADIEAWSKAIDQSGRAIWLSASAWPVPLAAGDALRQWVTGVRIDSDVECYCDTVSNWENSVMKRWDDLPNWLDKLRWGNFHADLDSMPISNNTGKGVQDGINDEERKSVMTFWAMASAPLYIGGDIYFMDRTAEAIVTNSEVIAVDQAESFPIQISDGKFQKWKKVMPNFYYVAVYNMGNSSVDITVNFFKDLGFSGDAKIRDLWSHSDLGTFTESWTASHIPSHGTRLIKVTPNLRV